MSTSIHSEHSSLQPVQKLTPVQARAVSAQQSPVSQTIGVVLLSVLGIGG